MISISKNHPIIGENVVITFVTRQVTRATVWAAENALYGLIIKETARWIILSHFNKDDKTPVLTKIWKILYIGFRAILSFWKFKVALNTMCRIFINFAKSYRLSCLLKIDNIKIFNCAVLELQALETLIKGVFIRSYCFY